MRGPFSAWRRRKLDRRVDHARVLDAAALEMGEYQPEDALAIGAEAADTWRAIA